eukprot:6837322-Prymnesium_polylepis.2
MIPRLPMLKPRRLSELSSWETSLGRRSPCVNSSRVEICLLSSAAASGTNAALAPASALELSRRWPKWLTRWGRAARCCR